MAAMEMLFSGVSNGLAGPLTASLEMEAIGSCRSGCQGKDEERLVRNRMELHNNKSLKE